MKNSSIVGLNQLPVSSYLERLSLSRKKKIFEEFVNFKNDDQNVATLSIDQDAQNFRRASNTTLTWSAPKQLQRKLCGRIDRPASEKLFTWDAVSEATSGEDPFQVLPFADGAFDWVFCESVIEHIGGFKKQYLLIKELMRVARKGVFVTTSNRWHPVEFYTALPLLHWLPAPLWKRALKFFGKEVWAGESMLNLLDAKVLEKMVSMLPEKPSCSIGHVRIMGIKAYFFLQLRKMPLATPH